MANTFKFGNGNWAVKKDSVLAYNDENNNFKPLPFDFTRDSTATYVDSDGLIKTAARGEARIDYLDNANGHLLLEPSRTNLVDKSEEFSHFSITNVTLTDDNAISPDGTLNATKLTDNTTSSTHRIYKPFTTSIGISVTYSIFLKKGTMTNAVLNLFSGATIGRATVDLDSGTITLNNGTSADIEDYGDDWYRCSLTGTTQNTSTLIYVYMSDSISAYVGTNQDLYVWGAQLEGGSYATSYIPTNGETNGVTRAAESANQTAPDGVIGQTEGTIYIQLGEVDADANDEVYLELNNGSGSTNRIMIYVDGSNYLRNYIKGSAVTSNIQTNYSPQANDKIAITYKTNEAKIFVNGIQRGSTDTTVTVPTTNRISLQANTSLRAESNNLKEARLYDTALTDAELITLTT